MIYIFCYAPGISVERLYLNESDHLLNPGRTISFNKLRSLRSDENVHVDALIIFASMKSPFPKAKRQLEYVAFFHFQVSTMEGPGYVFVAVDAFSQYAFSLGVERNDSPATILKNINFLLDRPDFVQHIDKGFTLVMGEHENLSGRIEAILKPVKGQLMFSKAFNSYLSNPVLKSFRDSMPKGKKRS